MKKILVLLLVLSLLALCGCKNSTSNDLPGNTDDPVNTSGNSTEDSGSDSTVDWETPIDIDDSVQQETEDAATEPIDEIDPTEATPTVAQPTEANPTEGNADPTEPDPTEAETDPPATSRPNSSGPIELPMVPG